MIGTARCEYIRNTSKLVLAKLWTSFHRRAYDTQLAISPCIDVRVFMLLNSRFSGVNLAVDPIIFRYGYIYFTVKFGGDCGAKHFVDIHTGGGGKLTLSKVHRKGQDTTEVCLLRVKRTYWVCDEWIESGWRVAELETWQICPQGSSIQLGSISMKPSVLLFKCVYILWFKNTL